MKKIYIPVFFLASAFLSATSFAQSAFTPGNLVVYKVGDGATTLSSAAFQVSLDEFTTSGTPVQSYPLPSSGSGTKIVAAGSTTSEGLITTSVDGKFLLVTGYNAASGTTGIAATTSAATNRVVGIIGTDGALDASTALTDAYSAGNIRSVVSTDGSNIWLGGSNAGVRYTTKGSTTSTQLNTTAPTNVRAVDIFNGQLYVTAASGAFLGLSAVGTGTPTAAGQTITLLPGFPTTGATPTPSPYAFAINTAGNIAYVADDRAIASGGGVQKWTLSGGTWTLAYTLGTSTARTLVVDWSGTNPVIYAVTTNSVANSIITTTDAGSTSTFDTLATAAPFYVYRGIAFAPTSTTVPVTLTSFKATPVNTAVQVQWATSQEIATKQFEVEKSTDAIKFVSIATIAAAGTAHTYSVQDLTPFAGVSYYRLKTIDINGNSSYSAIVPVSYSLKTAVKIYPNPAHDLITVTHPASSNATVTITDAQGSTIETLSINAGETVTTINVSTLSSGQYFIKYVDTEFTSTSVLNKL